MSIQLYTFPIDSYPYGLSYADWSVKWWKWISSIPKESNPTLDWTGVGVHTNQIFNNIFFLCQTYEGVKDTPLRRNKIPKGTSIFMPIINWISILHQDGETDEELIKIAKNKMDLVGPLEITINDDYVKKGLEKYRVQSPFFEIELPKNNIFGLNSGKRRCISEGYWIFLRPIYQNIILKSFSSCSSGLTTIKVNYDLSVY